VKSLESSARDGTRRTVESVILPGGDDVVQLLTHHVRADNSERSAAAICTLNIAPNLLLLNYVVHALGSGSKFIN